MILFLHHRYRTTGGEERAVEDLAWLVRERLGEDAEVLQRDSRRVSGRAAAAGLLAGGLRPEQVARAVRHTRARVVHAHNLHPTLGWRALAAARAAGAATVLHLHQYRLVCAIGVCFRDGRECTECHGANTLPGVLHNCRGSRAEAVAYGLGLAAWQRRLIAQADVVVVPSRFAEGRLRALGAPLGPVFVVPNPIREVAELPDPPADREEVRAGAGRHDGHSAANRLNGHALLAGRLVTEKGVAVAIEACRLSGIPLQIAGEGPERERLEPAAGPGVRFLGRVDAARLDQLRRGAAIALVPSLFAETFGLSAAEAMAAGVPVAASRIGALPELVPEEWLAPPGDPRALAEVIERLRGDRAAPARAIAAVRARAAPEVVAPALADVYARATAARATAAGATAARATAAGATAAGER